MTAFVSLTMKVQFFDKDAVKNAIKGDMYLKLLEWGAVGRKIVSRAPRRRKGKSKAGQTPTAWKGLENGMRTLRRALFAYAGDFKVIFGPTGLGNSEPVTQKLEVGGKNSKVKNKFRRKRYILSGAVMRIDGPPSKSTKSVMSPITKKKMDVTFGLIRSADQLARANRMEEEVWGKMEFDQTIEARPFVGPSVVKTAEKFEAVFSGNGVTASVNVA